MYKILHKEVLAPEIKLMHILAPEIAKKAEAGQFIILRIDEMGERVPLTMADWDEIEGTVTIIFQEVGYSTKKLGMMEEGESLLDFVGPLGLPSEIENYGKVVCVGGGVGVAPLYPVARALKNAGNEVISIIGARSKDYLILEEKMKSISDQLFVATDDGSYGYHGFVTGVLKEVLEKEENIARVWVIGPMVMMRAATNVISPYKIKTIASLNPIMVDGTGMCGVCRVNVGNETKFACVDGPEFDAELVDWDLAIHRLNFYRDKEKEAVATLSCGGNCHASQYK